MNLRSSLVLFALPAALLATSVASNASAEKEKAKSTSSDSIVSKLPKSSSIKLPRNVVTPKSIPATDQVEGFYVDIPPHVYRYAGEGPSYAMVYASKEAADAQNNGTPAPENTACFMTAYPNPGGDVNWSNSFSTVTSVQNYKRSSYGPVEYGSVQLVRSDSIQKLDGDKLTYSVRTAFVDADTQGVQLHTSQSIELIKLKELPGRVTVWGTLGDGDATFLVQRKKHEKERFFQGPLMVNSPSGINNLSAQDACPVVFSLKTGKGVATSAVITLDAVLDVVSLDEEEGSGFVASSLSFQPALPSGQLEAKVRTMRIGFSSTWMSQDTEPVISVSSGWSGRERTQPL